MANTYVIPVNPTAAELQTALIDIANNMSKTADLLGQYKKAVADATTKYKRAYARALVNNQGTKNVALQKALAEIDDLVIATQDEVDKATTTYTLAMGEYEGMETQFVALRKVVEIQKLEYKGEYGNGI